MKNINLQPTPVLLPRKSHGWRRLVGYGPWCRKELDTTEWLYSFHTQEDQQIPSKNKL